MATYHRMLMSLATVRLRQAVRFGPSVVWRLCFILIAAAVLALGCLVVAVAADLPPVAGVTLALTAAGLVAVLGAILVTWGRDADLAEQREKLTAGLPRARAVWILEKERRRAERQAERERRREELEIAREANRERQARVNADLGGRGGYNLDIVGESHYQAALERLAGGRSEDGVRVKTTATLILETNNPHDPQAVRVDIRGRTVGHLSREDARTYRLRLRQLGCPNLQASFPAIIVGGWNRGGGDRGHFGVKLDVEL
jgi:hypothetical protein